MAVIDIVNETQSIAEIRPFIFRSEPIDCVYVWGISMSVCVVGGGARECISENDFGC